MTFRIALSGLNAASADLSVTANNIANANTNGFKSSRALFGDLFASGELARSDTQIGGGTRLAEVQQQFGQGNINFTSNALDMAISGDGFFTLSAQGALSYSRDGAFQVDREGFLVNTEGLRLQGFEPTAGGGFNTAGLSDIQLDTFDNPPSPTTAIALGLNLPGNADVPATAPFDAADADTFNHSSALTVFDSLGSAHTVTSFFVKTATANEWEVNITIDGASAGAATAVSFDSNGVLTTPANGQVTIPTFALTNGAADLDMTLDVGSATQFGDNFSVNSITQDGFTSGKLVGVEVSEGGVLQARFTNGQTSALSQLALTKFANVAGLQALGDTSWGESFSSGPAQRGTAGNGGLGLIQSAALEASNVDLTEQLVNMITAQRNFQANAQMITTADQVTQAALNIR